MFTKNRYVIAVQIWTVNQSNTACFIFYPSLKATGIYRQIAAMPHQLARSQVGAMKWSVWKPFLYTAEVYLCRIGRTFWCVAGKCRVFNPLCTEVFYILPVAEGFISFFFPSKVECDLEMQRKVVFYSHVALCILSGMRKEKAVLSAKLHVHKC